MSYMEEQLRDHLSRQVKPILICGAGVTRAATAGAAPDWIELLASGVARALRLNAGLQKWTDYTLERIQGGSPRELTAAAEDIADRLGGRDSREFYDWMREEVGELTVKSSDLLSAIFSLDCQVATTNLDGILSEYSGRPVIDWTEYTETARFLKGDSRGILHLHGQWRTPRSVVLGSDSYNSLLSDTRRTFLAQLSGITRATVLIGCSRNGINDPDFARTDEFLTQWQSAVEPRFWLVSGDSDNPPPVDTKRRLYPIVFGKDYEALPSFLARFGDHENKDYSSQSRSTSPLCIEQQEPKSNIFGRGAEAARIIKALIEGRSVTIGGGPGFGKTSLAVSVLYSQQIRSAFGPYRVFVSCEGLTDSNALLPACVRGMGVDPAPSQAGLLLQLQRAVPIEGAVVLLDNLEDVLDVERDRAERVIRLIAQTPRLRLVTTQRGIPPLLPGAELLEDLPILCFKHAKQAFLAIATERFVDDPDLVPLLNALEGHPLSIELLAAQSVGQKNLHGLLSRWEEEKAAILRRPGGSETRLTSVRASLSLSLKNPLLKNSAASKRLISLIAQLPAGMTFATANRILGRGTLTRGKILEAIDHLQRLRILENRPDDRLRMLNPIRESIKIDVAMLPTDSAALKRHYLEVATTIGTIATSKWSRVDASIVAELPNVDPILGSLAEETKLGHQQLEAFLGLADYVRFSGIGQTKSVERAAEVCESRHRYDSASRLFNQLSTIAANKHDYYNAERYSRAANETAEKSGDRALVAAALIVQSRLSLSVGDASPARNYAEQGLRLARSARDIMTTINTLISLAIIAEREGSLVEARRYIDEALPLAQNHSPLSVLHLRKAKERLAPEPDEDTLLDIADAYRAFGVMGSLADTLCWLGIIRTKSERYDEAADALEEARDIAQRKGAIEDEASAIAGLGLLLRKTGEPSATAMIDQAFYLWESALRPENPIVLGLGMLRRLASLGAGDGKENYRKEVCAYLRHIAREDIVKMWLGLF